MFFRYICFTLAFFCVVRSQVDEVSIDDIPIESDLSPFIHKPFRPPQSIFTCPNCYREVCHCDAIHCPKCLQCVNGDCEPLKGCCGKECPACYKCINNACVRDPYCCDDVICNRCDQCVNGKCVPLYDCCGKICPPCYSCINNQCVHDPNCCGQKFCAPCFTCINGNCVRDPGCKGPPIPVPEKNETEPVQNN